MSVIATKKNQRLIELSDSVQLLVTDHGLDYGYRFTAEVYSATGRYCGSLGMTGNHSGEAGLDSFDDLRCEARTEQFAARYDQCILKARAASAGK